MVEMLVGRMAAAQRRVLSVKARRFAHRETPELLRAYAAFEHANQISVGRQPFKGWDLWRLLDRSASRYIVELGSGTTSAAFALWARRHQASYVAYEHDPQWARITRNCLEQAGVLGESRAPIRLVPCRTRDDGQATGFVSGIPLEADFVYVDGPPCRLGDGRKVANDDVVRLFDAGGRPRTIVVDGRWETVDLIRNHPVGARYRCALSYVCCYQHRRWSGTLKYREHTVFSA